MFSKAPVITNIGKTLLLRAAAGEQITFTKFKAGNGTMQDGETEETMADLHSVIVDDIEAKVDNDAVPEEGYIQIIGSFDNQNNVRNDFMWTELGLFARVDNTEAIDYGTEYLYAYGYESKNAETIVAGGNDVAVEQNISLNIAIGTSGNISVNISQSIIWAKAEDLNAHKSNTNNPHNVTCGQIGAAQSEHNHSAANITSGTLPVERGGTGVNTSEAMRGLFAPVHGMYTGDGTTQRDINLGFHPNVVIYTDEGGTFSDDVKGSTGGIILRDYPHYTWDVGYGSSRTDQQKVAEITATGFRLYSNGANGHTGRRPNQSGIRYFYIAW